jgi:hypothetical protein
MLPTRSIALCGAGHCDTSIPPGHWLLHRDSAAYRIDDARARPTRQAAPADKKGVGYWVVVDFDMNIIDFLVTLNVTVSRMINWRNTASQFGHTVTNKTGMAVTVVMHFSHTEIIQ